MNDDGIPRTVDEYFSRLPEDQRKAFEVLRGIILDSIPGVEERISYRIPTYFVKGPLFHFNVAKNHMSLVTVKTEVIVELKEELKGFKVSGTTIQFTPEKPIPKDLVRKIVMTRLKYQDKKSE